MGCPETCRAQKELPFLESLPVFALKTICCSLQKGEVAPISFLQREHTDGFSANTGIIRF